MFPREDYLKMCVCFRVEDWSPEPDDMIRAVQSKFLISSSTIFSSEKNIYMQVIHRK